MDSQPKKFRYTLNIRGVDSEPLDNAPDGWLKTTIKFARSKKYGGLVRSLTLPLKFVLYGAGLLRQEFYNFGILSRVTLLIERLVNRTWTYKKMYLGKLDFSKASDDLVGFTVNATEADFSVQIAAYDDVDYAIPLDGPDVITIGLPALELRETAALVPSPPPDNNIHSDYFPPIFVAVNQQNAIGASVKDVEYRQFRNPDFSVDGSWFFNAQVDTTVQITGYLHLKINVPGSHPLRLFFCDQTGTVKYMVYDQVAVGPFDEFDAVLNAAFTVSKGDRLFLYMQQVDTETGDTGITISTGEIDLEYNTTTPSTNCKGLKAYDLFQRLLRAMNNTSINEPNQPVPNQSFLLTTNWKNLAYTCSDSIRQTTVGNIYQAGDTLPAGGEFQVVIGSVYYNGVTYTLNETFKFKLGVGEFTTTDGGVVKEIALTPNIIISFKKFFQDIYSLQGGNCGFGLEAGIAVLEELPYFYRKGGGQLDCGNVTNYKLEPAVDLMYNTIRVGYQDQQYDAINGLQEVNSIQQYVTDLLEPQVELNLVASSRADCFGIEQTRITPTDSSASRSDNDVFMIYLFSFPDEGGIWSPMDMTGATSYSGVDRSYYNWFLSPKRNLLRGGAFLSSVFFNMKGYQIRLASGLKNLSLVTVDGAGIRAAEADPVEISALPKPIFIPFYVSFKPGLEVDAIDVLDTTPYGDIKFTFNDVSLRGFIQEINVDVGENSAQDFKLLLTPDNNLLNLIH